MLISELNVSIVSIVSSWNEVSLSAGSKLLFPEGRQKKQEMDSAKKKELEAKLADLKGRWPAHSVPISMWHELEELEEELKKIEKERQNND